MYRYLAFWRAWDLLLQILWVGETQKPREESARVSQLKVRGRRVGRPRGTTHQLLKYTLVERPLRFAAQVVLLCKWVTNA